MTSRVRDAQEAIKLSNRNFALSSSILGFDIMSQLHQEGIRRQLVADKRSTSADLSWLLQKAASSPNKQNSNYGLRSVHSASPNHSTHNSNYAVRSIHSSGPRSQEVVITDPYLDAITKETRARTRKRLTSTDYLMQW